MTKELILVLGGARAGKSTYAERLAARLGGDEVAFVATAEALDDEMRARIRKHQESRPVEWRTVEAPLLSTAALGSAVAGSRAVVVDCLTLLVSNVLLQAGGTVGSSDPTHFDLGVVDIVKARVKVELDALLQAFRQNDATWIVVSNEVGLGLVPNNGLGRLYRDVLGWANQRLALTADRVLLLIAGLPVQLKPGGAGA